MLSGYGVYNIPVMITGQNNYSTNNLIGLVVAGITNFDVSYVETLGSFSLNVANVGISPASKVAAVVNSSKNAEKFEYFCDEIIDISKVLNDYMLRSQGLDSGMLR